jgi:hypothetical protein
VILGMAMFAFSKSHKDELILSKVNGKIARKTYK